MESISIEDALIPTETFGLPLRLLLADYSGDWISELFTLPAALELLDDARDARRLRDHRLARRWPTSSMSCRWPATSTTC